MFCCFSHRGQPRKGSKSSSAGCKPSLVTSPESSYKPSPSLCYCVFLSTLRQRSRLFKNCVYYFTPSCRTDEALMLSEKQLAHSRQVLSKTTIQILIFINIFIFTYHICLNHSKCVNQFLNLPTQNHKKEMSKLLPTPITAPEMPRGAQGTAVLG